MGKLNVVKLTGRDTNTDPLTNLLRDNSEQLVYQVVEGEPQKLWRNIQADRK